MDFSLGLASAPRPLKTTTSRCPRCLAAIPAEVVEADGRIVMRKRCSAHGAFESVLASDPAHYHLARGADRGTESGCCGSGCGCTPAPAADAGSEKANLFESLSTCVALIEIVDTCNLTCPTCYASSPFGVGDDLAGLPFADFVGRVSGVLERKGTIDILQLSGGEPTLHPEFEAILRWCTDESRIGYTLVNTNGVRLATDDAFRARLGTMRRAGANFELYLQFDGPQEAGQRALRGADLRAVRERAADECGAAGIPTTLAMTVTPENLPHVGEALQWGLARPHVRGITFQPVFTSGRVPEREAVPIGVADVVAGLVAQAPGLVAAADFTPLPCGDPNCHTIGYLLRTDDGPVGLSRLVDVAAFQDFLADRLDYRIEDLLRCGCETEPLGELIKSLELGPDRPYRIFIKPFMDAWTFDQDRIDRCCTHVIRPDGQLDSFCRYYLHGGAAAYSDRGTVPLTVSR
ncbi:MAG: radical SAM protein [Phycisphaerales bacterium]|nr:radical SAM protein [Phycisphaerales bacterium]